MALPLLALGKIVSGVVTGTAKGLAVAGKATVKGSKVVGRAAGKAARAGGELAIDTASAAKKGFIKGVRATTKGLQKAASATKKSMSNFGKRMSNRKTGAEKLKRDANKIKSNLTQDIKKIKKQRLDRERIERNVLERKEIRNMEKNIKSSKTPTGKKVQSILKSPMSIIDKLFGLGSILLTGIVVNAIDDIIKKFKEFKENNQGLFDNIAKILTVIKDSFVYLFDEMTKPFGKEGALDDFAKFDDDGNLQSGKLKDLQNAIKKLGPLVTAFSKLQDDLRQREKTLENLKSNPFDPNTTIIKEEIDENTGEIKKLTANEFNKKTYYLDQNGTVRFKKNDVPAIFWNAMATEKDKKILDRKPYYKQISFSKINPDNLNNSVFNLNPDLSNSIIFAYQKEIEYVPLDLGTGSNINSEESFNYDELKLPSIWTND